MKTTAFHHAHVYVGCACAVVSPGPNLTEMHFRVLIVFFAVALLSLSWQVEGGKLQIGVKKKVENCERRTKKGDRLQMHYTVRPHPQTTDI